MSGAILTVDDAASALRAIVAEHLPADVLVAVEDIIARARRMHVAAPALRMLEAAALDLLVHESGRNTVLADALVAYRAAVKSALARAGGAS